MKLIRGILDLVMAGFLLVCMLLSVPKLWGYGIYTVTSGSMEPEIHTGDVIYTMPVEFQELREGDVITFSMNQGKTTVTHRIQKIDQKNRLIQTKGDANKENDRTWITEIFHSQSGLSGIAGFIGKWKAVFIGCIYVDGGCTDCCGCHWSSMWKKGDICLSEKRELEPYYGR